MFSLRVNIHADLYYNEGLRKLSQCLFTQLSLSVTALQGPAHSLPRQIHTFFWPTLTLKATSVVLYFAYMRPVVFCPHVLNFPFDNPEKLKQPTPAIS